MSNAVTPAIVTAAPDQVFITPAAVTPPAPAPAPATPPAAATPAAPAPEAVDNPWADPVAAKAEIERLRRENGADRVNAKQTAADEARQELTKTLAKALGLVDGDTPPDPAKLTEQLTTAQQAATDTARDFAIYKAASTAGADPQALLDSLAFQNKVQGIDPTDTTALEAAITEAVKNNPRFKTAQAAGPSGADFTGGTGEDAMTQAKFDALTPQQKNDLYTTNPTQYRQFSGR